MNAGAKPARPDCLSVGWREETRQPFCYSSPLGCQQPSVPHWLAFFAGNRTSPENRSPDTRRPGREFRTESLPARRAGSKKSSGREAL